MGTTEESKPLPASERQRRLDLFDSVVVPTPRMKTVEDAIANLAMDTSSRVCRHQERLQAAGGRPVKADELWVLPIIGPSGSGKSKTLEGIVDRSYLKPGVGADDIPYLILTLEEGIRTPRALQAQVLAAFGDPAATAVLKQRDYIEQLSNEALRKVARVRGTSVILIDEAHNMSTSGGSLRKMAAALKSMVNQGLFSIVLVGTEDIEPLIYGSPELHSRVREPIYLDPFTLEVSDCRNFIRFVARFENQLLTNGALSSGPGCASSDGAPITYDMTDGGIGAYVRIMRMACERAFKRGSTDLTWLDISEAYIAWWKAVAVVTKHNKSFYNPMHHGPRLETKTQVAAALANDTSADAEVDEASNG